MTLYKRLKRLFALGLAIAMLGTGMSIPKSSEVEAQEDNFANVVVFIEFSDTSHEGHSESTNIGGCFAGEVEGENFTYNADETFELFNGDEEHPRAFKQYIDNISYGNLRVKNIFPQYDESAGTITPFVLSKARSAYEDDDYNMVKETIDLLKNSNKLTGNIDYNSDGCIDNLTIVVAGGNNGRNSTLYPHKANYDGLDSINSKSVATYNVLTEEAAYGSVQRSGVIIHEFLHSIGYPDLYRYDGNGSPVGRWDIMASVSTFVSYPLAYLRYAYTHWIDIPTVTTNKDNYTLYAPSIDGTHKDNQAVILKTAYSDTEFFVIEYRKKPGYSVENINSSYDYKIPDSGIIIYRVNTAIVGNSQGAPDMIYVFRPDDSYDDSGNELGMVQTENYVEQWTCLSSESGNTSYGSSNLSDTLTDGAITYSDGTNSGIVISNVGSTSGDFITCDISFADTSNAGYWKTVSELSGTDSAYTMDSFMDSDGTLYYVHERDEGDNYKAYLYKLSNGSYSKLSSAITADSALSGCSLSNYHVAKVGGDIYVVYNYQSGSSYDAPMYFGISKLQGSVFKNIYKSIETSNALAISSDSSSVYIASCNGDNSVLKAYKIYAGSVTSLGTVAESTKYISNPSISADGNNVAIMYREAFNNNKIGIKLYDKQNNSWNNLGNLNMSASSGMIKLTNGKLYFLKNGSSFTDTKSYAYVYDLSNSAAGYTLLGSNMYADESIVEMDIVDNGGNPYIIYQGGSSDELVCMYLDEGEWKNLGAKLTNNQASCVSAYVYSGYIYVTYISSVNSRIYIKRYETVETGGETTDPKDPVNPVNPVDPTDPDDPVNPDTPKVIKDVSLHYRTHVQDIGWQGYVGNNRFSGTEHMSKRLEGINIYVTGNDNLGIRYTTHVQDYGWLPWSSNNDMSGTEGESKRLEAIMIKLTGKDSDNYDVYYKVHVQDMGWLDWAKNGEPAGTAGFSYRLEGIYIDIVKKGDTPPQRSGSAYVSKTGSNVYVAGEDTVNVLYRTHVQDYGWQGYVYNKAMSGTSGQSKRLEGINIKLSNKPVTGGISYQTHIQDIGWQSYKSDGELSGTSGQSKRLEAIRIKLTGDMENEYDVYYRVHAEDYGWLGWAKNGEASGTQGKSKRLEGIQIILVKKGGNPPGSTSNAFIK